MTNRERLLSMYTTNFILRYYPEIKQKSDDIDWKLHTARLVTYSNGNLTTDQIGKAVYESAARILEKQSDFNTELENLNNIFDLKDSWEQLLKVGIRTGWVNIIKQIYYQIINDTTIPDNKLYFIIKEKYPPLTDYLS
jgi:hypothetical protein